MLRSVLAGSGGVAAAFLGALCCTGPLIFVTFGVGAGLASTFEPLRPLFGALMLAAFAVGFYAVYGRRRTAAAGGDARGDADAACEVPRSRAREKAILWIALVIAIILWTFPSWSVWLL